MKLPVLASAALLAIASAAPAQAATLEYLLTGTDVDGTIEFASFKLDSNPVILPNNVGAGEGFRVKFVSGIFQYGTQISFLQDLQFFNGSIGGGFFNLDPADKVGTTQFLNVGGPQLYTGPEATPTLLAGNFAVYDVYSNAPLRLTVTQVAAAVPEPASWAVFIGGLGLIGAVMRRRPARQLRRSSRRCSQGCTDPM